MVGRKAHNSPQKSAALHISFHCKVQEKHFKGLGIADSVNRKKGEGLD